MLNPLQPSPRSGASETRARVGLRPNNPQHEAGTRIEPPPSLAWAAGTIPAATAAAAPPDEPPVMWSRLHGLRVCPNRLDSVVVVSPSSGEALRPNTTSPARR